MFATAGRSLQRARNSSNGFFFLTKRAAGGFNSKFHLEKPFDSRTEVDPMYEYDPNFRNDSTVREYFTHVCKRAVN